MIKLKCFSKQNYVIVVDKNNCHVIMKWIPFLKELIIVVSKY